MAFTARTASSFPVCPAFDLDSVNCYGVPSFQESYSLIPRRLFCPSIPRDLFSLQRLFTRELVEVRKGENKNSPILKLLHVFPPGCKAGEGLVWWSSQESQSNSSFGHHQSVFPCGKTQVHTAGKQEPGLVGRRSQCAAWQGLQSFRGLPCTCHTPGSGWFLCPAQEPLKWHHSATGEWSCGCLGR